MNNVQPASLISGISQSKYTMSLPRSLYSESNREPLLPTSRPLDNGASRSRGIVMSETGLSIFPTLVETSGASFTTEPFHRFGNAAAAGAAQNGAAPLRSPGRPDGDETTDARFLGGVDGGINPEVVEFAIQEQQEAGTGSRPAGINSANGKAKVTASSNQVYSFSSWRM